METLLKVCALPPSQFCEVTRTSDGYYLARAVGDIGLNAFLGRPNPKPKRVTLDRSWGIFRALTLAQRKHLVHLARSRNVILRDFLLK